MIAAVQDRHDAIVRHVQASAGWVPVADLARWMRSELRLGAQQGDQALRDLCLLGRLERRAFAPAGSFFAEYEYRVGDGVPRPAAHSGRPRAQRRSLAPTAGELRRRRVLAWLRDHEGQHTVRTIASALGIAVQNAWTSVRELEKRDEVVVRQNCKRGDLLVESVQP